MAAILVIGGTRFMGFFLTDELLKRGHDLTLIHRGNTVPDGIPNTRNIIGDRESSLDEAGNDYDVVIDTSGTLPRQVRASTAHCINSARYVFVSTVSVYRDPLAPFADESAPRCPSGDPNAAGVTSGNYGTLKVACEDIVLDAFGDRALIVRPGLIVGPRDYSDRFTYWVRRLSIGGNVLAPGSPDRAIQVVDARDLGHWIAQMVERRETGVYNATGPTQHFGEFLSQCERQSTQPSTLCWLSDEALIGAGIQPGNELPLWIPESDAAGWSSISSENAVQRGLSSRPIEATILDTLHWDRERHSPPLKCGLTLERERELMLG
jgi:2'-hydroxyisoflavone reductase